MYTALQELDPGRLLALDRAIFGVLATINVVLVLINFYIAQAQIIHWRLWLNQRMVDDWLNGAAYHRGRFVAEPIDNPDQRIQEDITSYAGTPRAWPWVRCPRWSRWCRSRSSCGACPAR